MSTTPAAPQSLRIGYVLKRFPRLSETFVLNDLLELERQGVEVQVFSLLKPTLEVRHALLRELKAPVTYLPGGGTLESWKVKSGHHTPQSRSILSTLSGAEAQFGDLFAGKTQEDICRLHLKATTIALMAKANGLRHLHAHFGSDATTVALLASRMSKIPFSFTAHARDIYHTYVGAEADAAMRRAKIAEADFVVTVSDYNRRYLSELAGPRAAGKIHRIYNGIDLGRFQSQAGGRGKPLILCVGRLIEKKGFCDLVEACGLLRDRNQAFECLVVGDGPERDALAQQVSELGLSDRFTLKGSLRQEELITLMGDAALAALPCVVSESGDRDGLPTVLLEALAAGLPVVTTTVSGGPEIVEQGENGLLVPPHDASALADALGRILADPALAENMGTKGRAKAEKLFDLRRNVTILRSHFVDTAFRGLSAVEAAQ